MQALLLRDTRTACTMHSIKHNRLEAAVLFAIQYQVGTAVSYSEMIAHINTAPLKKSQSHRLNDQTGGESNLSLKYCFRNRKNPCIPSDSSV